MVTLSKIYIYLVNSTKGIRRDAPAEKHFKCQSQNLTRTMCCPCARTNLVTWIGIIYIHTVEVYNA